MNPTDIYCRKKARDRLINKGISQSEAFVISEYVNGIVQKGLNNKKKKCDKCAAQLE
jgi:hypothetical protein